MRLVSAKLKGLKGIYSKSGIKDIYIDFTKCTHNIIYIIGKNGSGKSTLMSVLHPLPDPPTMYIDGEAGEKEIIFYDNNVYYIIRIQYPVYSNGTRAVTKAYLAQQDSNGTVELNPNGTIGSFKDALFSRFSLDPNFIALSHLSVEDRGIVDKKPAERKKYIGSLLESIDVYNDIYKTLVKRSGVFKSLVNSISAKIDNVGDEQQLIMQKSAIESRLAKLEMDKVSLEQAVSKSEATIQVIDPDGQLQLKYNDLLKKLNEIKDQLALIDDGSTDSVESLVMEHSRIKDIYTDINKDIEVLQEKIDQITIGRNEDAKIIVIKTQKYKSMMSNSNKDDLKRSITELRKKLFEYEQIFKKIGISGDSVTKDEYITGLNILEDLRTSVLNIKSYASNEAIVSVCGDIMSGRSTVEALNGASEDLNKINDDILICESNISYYNIQISKLSILEKRPSSCTINTCSFIKDAIEAEAEQPREKRQQCIEQLDKLKEKRVELQSIVRRLQLEVKVYNDLNIVIRSISTNSAILNKLPNGSIFSNSEEFLRRVSNGDTFNDIYELYQYIEYANIFDLYKVDSNSLANLEKDLELVKNQESLVDDLQKEIDSLRSKLDGIDKKISQYGNEMLEKKKKLADYDNQLHILDSKIARSRAVEELKKSKNELESQLRVISGNIDKIALEIKSINQAKSQLYSITQEIGPLYNQKDAINYSCNKLIEYKADLQLYTEKYNLVELLKKYSSPTKGGIQTIFIQLYMDKTLSMSNQLLSMMFGGELELLPYVISENEFRIPTRNRSTNLVTDDISNCSTSEKSMIAMIMSFVLAFQGSSVYNIIRLDEVDGGLDQYNRSIFPQILNSMMSMLNIEQCLIVSHSSESDMSDVDIISLTQVSHETMKGNVIFQL
jgi:hypothetical protein